MSAPAVSAHWRRAALSFGVLALLLAPLCVWLALRAPPSGAIHAIAALNDPDLKAQVMAELVRTGQGVWDSHIDPAVARVLQPNLKERKFEGQPVSSNAFGMREKAYALPKPAGLIRVVLLGDSFVFGEGALFEDRVGAQLDALLRERATLAKGKIECLSLAIGSWNALAESTYVRRQLSDLQPDLVVQQTCSNDLDDTEGVRGFGSKSRFSPLYPERADARVTYAYPKFFLGLPQMGCLHFGLDYESQRSLRTQGEAIVRLRDQLEARGARYVLLGHWGTLNWVVERWWGARLKPAERLYLPGSFYNDTTLWVRPDNSHWGRAGAERVARLLYGMLLERDWLPQAGLSDWPEARADYRAVSEQGRKEAERSHEAEEVASSLELVFRLDFDAPLGRSAQQIHTGVDTQQLVSPYASFALRNLLSRARKLELRAEALERRELDGTRVAVWCDEFELGSFALSAGQPIAFSAALPEALWSRAVLNPRLISEDFGYTGAELQHAVVFRIHSIGLAE